MTCGIGLPWTDTCTHPAGHLGRCSWDRGPALDPIYEEHTTPNLLNPRQVEVNQAPRSVFMPGRYHATRSGYNAGCRCELCVEANSEYMRGYRARSVDSPA